MDVTRVESFEPDYKTPCSSCDADPEEQPTVTGWKYGRKVLNTGLCGPCCWGEADKADPRLWNG